MTETYRKHEQTVDVVLQTYIQQTFGLKIIKNKDPAHQESCDGRYPVSVNEMRKSKNDCVTEH